MEKVTRVCLVTGASGLLGTAFIERHAPDFRIVAVHHRHPVMFATGDQRFVDPLAPSAPVAANAHAVHSVRADLRAPSDVERLLDDVSRRFGMVDLLLNLAAIRGWMSLLTPGAMDVGEAVLRMNVAVPLRLSVAVARRFWMSSPGENQRANRHVLNLSSSAGIFVYPDLGQAAYAASKAALNHLTYHLASEFWDIGVRVNAVAPDSFPGRVGIGRVLDTIADLDAGTGTGRIVPVLPADGDEGDR
jgi:NAD(P)-dependent dehydrogenase (short-subunit alcohol dehydrogenase family)